MINSLLTATGLGLGAGVNAYATLLVFGLLSRWHPSLFHDDLATFFASTPVLIVVGVLYLIEFVADKLAKANINVQAVYVVGLDGDLRGIVTPFDVL